MVAAPILPLAVAISLLAVYPVVRLLNIEFNNASFVVLPTVAIIGGIPLSYVIAFTCFMPLLLLLRRSLNRLRVYHIVGVGLALASMMAMIVSAAVARQASASDFLFFFLLWFGLLSIGSVASSLVFWRVAIQAAGSGSERFLGVTHAGSRHPE